MAFSLTCFDDIDPSKGQELDALDGRFQSVASMVMTGNYERAASDSSALFREGIYDIRLACYVLLGPLHADGPERLGDILETTTNLVRDHLHELGPAEEREAELERSLEWWANQMLTTLRGLQKARSDGWKRWFGKLERRDCERLIETTASLVEALKARGVNQPTSTLEALSGFLGRVGQDIELGDAFLEAEAQAQAEETFEDKGFEPLTPPTLDGLTSPALSDLLARLRAFEALCNDEDFTKATVIFNGLNQALSSFDPRVYFPQIFSPFYAAAARHIPNISMARDHGDQGTLQQLDALYRVDLDAFMALDFHEDDE